MCRTNLQRSLGQRLSQLYGVDEDFRFELQRVFQRPRDIMSMFWPTCSYESDCQDLLLKRQLFMDPKIYRLVKNNYMCLINTDKGDSCEQREEN